MAEGPRPKGTAFLVYLQDAGTHIRFHYLVTGKHNIEKVIEHGVDGIIHLRMNGRDCGVRFVETRLEDWFFHPSDQTVDVAVLPIPNLPMEIAWPRSFPLDGSCATPERIKDSNLGPGDTVLITGLFTSHYGKERNIPIIRMGGIAAMPEEPIAVKWCEPQRMEAYLIEVRSIGGLSGSPVFDMPGPRPRTFVKAVEGGAHVRLHLSPLFLLGLIHGHWDHEAADPDSAQEDAANPDRVNSGIAIVVPVTRILEVINQPALAQKRAEQIAASQKDSLAVPDA